MGLDSHQSVLVADGEDDGDDDGSDDVEGSDDPKGLNDGDDKVGTGDFEGLMDSVGAEDIVKVSRFVGAEDSTHGSTLLKRVTWLAS